VGNQILTRQEITWESLEVLENELNVLPNFYRDLDQEFGKKGGKIGDTIYVRKPPRAVGRDGQAYQPEGMTDTQVPVTINQQSGVDFEFSSAEKFLSIDDFRNRYLEPYMISLANKLDLRCALTAQQNTANGVGTPGTPPGLSSTDAFYIYAQAGQRLQEEGFNLKPDPVAVITPAMRTAWLDFNKAFFNPTGDISKQWKTGQVSNALGYRWFIDQNMPTQVIGALGGTPAVVGGGQTGTSINTNGWSDSIAGLLNIGDVISFANVFAVNPQSRQSTGTLRNFVVQAPAASSGTGTSTLTILPAIVPSGQFQNVTNSPAAGGLINVYGTAAAGQSALSGLSSPQGLVWTKQAYAFVSFPGDVPEGVDMGMEDRSSDIGVSLRFVRIWDGYRDQWVNRFDVYYGVGILYMEGGCRIFS
jgi:P22 coat protein - gene protein 5